MQRRLFDSALAPLVALASRLYAKMDGTADADKNTREAMQGYISDLKGLIGTAKDGASAVSTFNETLIKDNYNLRESKRQLKADLEAAKKLPDGSRVIAGDDVKLFDGFKQLNMKPEDVTTALVAYDDLRVGQTARDASDAIGWKFPVLKKLIETQGLEIEMKDVEVEEEQEGKKVKVKKPRPFVLTDDNKSIALDEFEPLKDFHTSLVKDEEGAGAGGRSTQGVRFPAQTGVGGNGTGGKGKKGEMTQAVTNTLDSRYRRPEVKAKSK